MGKDFTIGELGCASGTLGRIRRNILNGARGDHAKGAAERRPVYGPGTLSIGPTGPAGGPVCKTSSLLDGPLVAKTYGPVRSIAHAKCDRVQFRCIAGAKTPKARGEGRGSDDRRRQSLRQMRMAGDPADDR